MEGFQLMVKNFVSGLSTYAADTMIPFMCFIFGLGLVMRLVIWFTVKREEWFAKEFEKRVNFVVENEEMSHFSDSFYVSVKKLLEKTYYEVFELRGIMKRRDPDYVTSLSDRVFLIQHGCALLVRDTLKQIRFLKHSDESSKKLHPIVVNVFRNNPCFSKVFGIFPSNKYNDLLNLLPGMFIIGGIFGTFLGIMKGLPELGAMNLGDVGETQETMKQFLTKISFSMGTSIIGIILSVITSIFNTVFSPEKVFVNTVDRFDNSMDLLWNRSKNNDLPKDIPDFDMHKDPVEAIAEEALNREIAKSQTTTQPLSKTERDLESKNAS